MENESKSPFGRRKRS